MSALKEIRKQIKLFLSFSAGERFATLMLFSLLLLVMGLIYVMPYVVQQPSSSSTLQTIAQWDADQRLYKKQVRSYKKDIEINHQPVVAMLFMFNPNTVSEQEAQRLGFSSAQIKNVMNYRKKGGVFRKKSDLSKLYTFDSASFARLKPYIDLPDSSTKPPRFADSKFSVKPVKIIELNTADSIGLVELKGIGPYSAMRILKYRNRLGGFTSTNQLKEVWGITDSLLQLILPQITLDPFKVQKISVNTATAEVLREHPYIWKWALARAIVNYREQHGRYKSTEDLRGIVLMHDSTLIKLEPYLKFD